MDTEGTPTPRKRRLRLTTLDHCREYVSGLLTRVENGELDEQRAKGRGYLVQIIASLVKESDLEQRLAELEARLGVNPGTQPRVQ